MKVDAIIIVGLSSIDFFLIGNKYIRVPTKHKKISELKIFNDQEYKLFRKRNKLDLKNERKLVELVKYFNDVVK